MTPPADPTQAPEQQALLEAFDALLLPLARLAVGRGLPFAAMEEQLKQAMVQAAREAALRSTPGALPHRLVSRISTATGINRREVTRLVHTDIRPAPRRPSPALRVFARWSADPAFQDTAGQPLTLPRQGPAPSFEALAASVTRDVHPRSLLDDMLRLKLADWDSRADTVHLSRSAFVPDDDVVRMLGYLGGNVGDHLSASVENIAGARPPHFEQAVLATGLSQASLHAIRPLVEAQWKHLIAALVPELQARIDADEAAAGPDQPGQLRIGLYAYGRWNDAAPAPAAPAAPPTENNPHD